MYLSVLRRKQMTGKKRDHKNILTLERDVSSKNCSVGSETAGNKEMLTSRGFTVYEISIFWRQRPTGINPCQVLIPHPDIPVEH